MSVTFPWSERFARELSNKEFRDAYVADHVRTSIAHQIRALREQPERNWSQSELGARANKKQSVVSRVENPDYGQVTLQTLFEIAAAFDVQLLVQFVECEDWLERMADVTPTGLQKRSFDIHRLLAKIRENSFEAEPIKQADPMVAFSLAYTNQLAAMSTSSNVIAGRSATTSENKILSRVDQTAAGYLNVWERQKEQGHFGHVA